MKQSGLFSRSSFFKKLDKKQDTLQYLDDDIQSMSSNLNFQIQSTLTQIKDGQLDLATNTIDPKVFEPFEPIQGRVPRNVEIERKKRQYQQIDLLNLFEQNGIDIQKEFKQNVYGKLNIQHFDDISYDDYEDCTEWLRLGIDHNTNTVKKLITGKAFIFSQKKNKFYLKQIVITNYDSQSQMFSAYLQQEENSIFQDEIDILRMFVCFDAENPVKYVKRIKNAIKKRNQCHLILKYNYIIDKMPLDNLIDMNDLILQRIIDKIFLYSTYEKSEKQIQHLKYIINQDYLRTQNKILFDVYLEKDKNQDLHPGDDMVYVVNKYCKFKLKSQQYGRLCPKREQKIKQTFDKFLFQTLYVKEETYYVLKEVHEECDKVKNMHIFYLEDFDQNQSLNVFINLQDSQLLQVVNYVKNTWIENLANIVNKYYNQIGKGWFNLNESNEYSFGQGKLKKLLNLLRYIMEDTIQYLLQNNYEKFTNLVLPKIPQMVVINSLKDVKQQKEGNNSLFEIDVVIEKESSNLTFSIDPEQYANSLKNVFYKPLKEIKKIPDLKPYIAKKLYNDKKEKEYIQIPTLTRDKTKKYSIQYIWLNEIMDKIDSKIENCVQPLKEYIIYHERFKKILQLNPQDVKQEMEEKEADVDILLQEIERSQQRSQEVQSEIPMVIEVGMFQVQQGDIVLQIKNKFAEISLNLKNLIYEKTMSISQFILNYNQAIINKFYQIDPKTIEEAHQILTFLDSVPQEVDKISYEVKIYNENINILDQLNFKIKQKELDSRWKIYGMKKDLSEKIVNSRQSLKEKAQHFKNQCEKDKEEIEIKIRYLEDTIKEVIFYKDLNKSAANNDLCQNIISRITEFIDQGIVLNKRQQMFEIENTNFSQLVEMQELFKPFNEFWVTANTWIQHEKSVLNDSLKNINSKATKKIQEQCLVKIKKVKTKFKEENVTHMIELSDTVFEKLEDFRKKIPILQSIKKEGLRERHWELIYQILNVQNYNKIIQDKQQHQFNFQYYLDLNIMQFQDQIIEISERAYREHKLEQQLNEIILRWEKVQFTIIKQDKTFLLKGFDDIQDMMDEDILKTQRMQFSIYKKPFENSIIHWNNNLKMMQEILEEWLKFQQKLLYLQPIFESADISEQLPGETKKFGTIQSFWKHLITNVKNNNNVQVLCLQEGILERLIDGCRSLEQIQNELKNYLERKREKFGRFYFLSNNDLIQILSIQRDPKSIIPHLNKVFENIEDIDFNENMEIISMVSKEQEVVSFEQPIITNNMLVEDWMKNMEAQMYKTVKIKLISCVLTGKKEFFEDLLNWIQQHPGMCIITVSKIIETFEIEKSFLALIEEEDQSSSESDSIEDSFDHEKSQEKKKNNSQFVGNKQQHYLNKYKIHLQNALNQLIETVKHKKLERHLKITVNSLIVTIVNCLENVEKFFDTQQFQNKQKLMQKNVSQFSNQRKSVLIEPLEFKKSPQQQQQQHQQQQSIIHENEQNLDSSNHVIQQQQSQRQSQVQNWSSSQKQQNSSFLNQKKMSLRLQQQKDTKNENSFQQQKYEVLDTFEWQMQLKTYMDVLQPNPDCKIKCVQSVQINGYEYLGNSQRLVITPLTEKCFISMMQAMKFSYAGALVGPAGTGKTETIKDLSKFVARQCVVFNCSEAMDYLTISKFFKGLACCGSWCCFDEFNRMHTEVLSVIAQQLLFLNQTKIQAKTSLKKFLLKKIIFEGSEIQVKHTFSVFITLNPGYQGKVDLPDNLKNQFRQMAMVIPHYEQITEILLYSYGFKEAKLLSQKINVSIKLAQDQLSSQPHYDYGLRAIKSIIIAAGQYKEDENSNDQSLEYEEDLVKKAINVVSLPKLVEQDEILFKNIIRDQFKYTTGEIVSVFSNKDEKQIQLQKYFIEIIKQNNLEPLQNHVQKLGQIYSVMKFRHGIMILGKAGTGKSTLINILGKTIMHQSQQENKGVFLDGEFKVVKQSALKVKNYHINPKSLTLGQLFGEYIIEWRDGVFSKVVRQCSNDLSKNLHLIVMDGPVDTYWIENINSVLDETRKLCLSNSQILNFTENMTMMFEIEDLENSSPSIVSRCGMVYVQDFEEQNIYILWESWLKNTFQSVDFNSENEKFLQNQLTQKQRLIRIIFFNLKKLLPYYLEPCFQYLKKLPSQDKIFSVQGINQIKDFLQIFECMINYQFNGIFFEEDEQQEEENREEYQNKNNNQKPKKQNQQQQRMQYKDEQEGNNYTKNISSLEKFRKLSIMLQPLFFQAIIWSFGTLLKEQQKEGFSDFLKNLIKKDPHTDQNKNIMQFPDKLSFFQVYFDTNEQRYIDIMSKMPEFLNSGKQIYTEMFCHNKNTISYIYLFKNIIENQKNFITLGPKSCGKTKIIQELINRHLNQDKFQNQIIQLSAETNITQINDLIDNKLEKRRKRVLGPQLGKTHVIFIDDLFLPREEEFGSQPPLELLRYFIEYQGLYQKKELEFVKYEDQCIMASCKQDLLQNQHRRLLRQFIVIGMDDITQDIVKSIFVKLTSTFMTGLVGAIRTNISNFVQSSINILNKIAQELLPTPSKNFYSFTNKDIFNTYNYIISFADPTYIDNLQIWSDLWLYETTRCFQDRLVTKQDINFVQNVIQDEYLILLNKLNLKQQKLQQETKNILWTKFQVENEIAQDTNDQAPQIQNFSLGKKQYKKVDDMQLFLQKMEKIQETYNNEQSFAISNKKHLNLIMFQDACTDIIKIARAVSINEGHSLTLGSAGKGRQSLNRLACFVADLKLFEIGLNQEYSIRLWQEDLKKIIMTAGLEKQKIALVISCKKIISEEILENLSQIMSGGEVCNLYGEKEQEEIYISCKNECVKLNILPTKTNIQNIYQERTKQNFHLMISMSPTRYNFASQIRDYPFLVGKCQIIYLHEWSDYSLNNIAQVQINEYSQEIQITSQKNEYAKCALALHKFIVEQSYLQKKNSNRQIHIEPIHFLDTLKQFKHIVLKKKQQFKEIIDRMSHGVSTIKHGQKQIEIMDIELNNLKPKLEQSAIEVENLLQQIQKDQIQNELKQEQVIQEEKQAKQQEIQAKELKAQAQAGVQLAVKQLQDTLQNLSKLKKEHLIEIKALGNPPLAVKTVLSGLVILLESHIESKGGHLIQGETQKDYNFFETAKRFLLNDPRELLEILQKYDKSSVTKQQLEKLEYYVLQKKEYSQQAVERCSYATKFLFLWVKCIVDYTYKYIATEPIRQELITTNQNLQNSINALQEKKNELQKIKDNLNYLQTQMYVKEKEKLELIQRSDNVTKQIQIAKMLTSGLFKEGIRWEKDIVTFQEQEKYILGNSLLVTIQLINFGPFEINYRNAIYEKGYEIFQSMNIMINKESTLINFLSTQNELYNMYCQGLPKDENSSQNAIIMKECISKWPLLIDPQEQASKYLNNRAIENGKLEILSENDKDILRILEIGISVGKWIVIKTNKQEFNNSTAIEQIFEKQTETINGQLHIKIGEKSLQMHEDYKFFIITSRDNPIYTPEIYVKLQVINFAISPQALEEQMLALIFSIENPRLEQRKINLREKIKNDKFQLQEIENTILRTLTETQDMNIILNDQKLVNQLSNSKNMSEQITQKMQEAQNTEKEIDESREEYRELAKRGALLYLSILDLSSIDIMYKYSLQWFQALFEKGFDMLNSVTKNFEDRLQALIEVQTELIFQNVVQSIYQKHKILYTFLLTQRLQEQTHPEIKKQQGNYQFQQEWNFFVNTLIENSTDTTNVFPNIIPQPWWEQIVGQVDKLQEIEKFSKIKKLCFKQNKELFLKFFLSEQPFKETEFYNSVLETGYTEFDKLILIKAFRIDKLPQSIECYVLDYLGENLMKNINVIDIDGLLKNHINQKIPIIFLLQSGIDPREQFLRYADEQNMQKKNVIVSLGQGQGKNAEQKIRLAKQRGHWVLLQNCHLATSWMPELDRIVNTSEQDQKIQIQKGYRLWLTTTSTPNFPLSILQNSIKITMQPSQGIKASLRNIYSNMSDLDLNDCSQVEQFKKILFGLSMFHSIIQERSKFGTIGWNSLYDFTDQDFSVSILQIKNIFELQEENSQNSQENSEQQKDDTFLSQKMFQSLSFLIGDIQYSGKVSDYHDQKFIIEFLKNFISKDSLEHGYKFSQELDIYYQIDALNIRDYQHYIQNLPQQTDPRALGLHQNSSISIGKQLSTEILECLKLSQNNKNQVKNKEENNKSQYSSSLNSSMTNSVDSQIDSPKNNNYDQNENESAINFLIHFIKQKIPQKFDLEEIKKNFKITYEQSYNTVLYQEAIRYNILLNAMHKSLDKMDLAYKGLQQLDYQLEQMSQNLLQQKIPSQWQHFGFQSMKPLAGWIKELNDRVNYLHDWIVKGEPTVFWLGAFFQPKIFIIATKLNFSRKNKVPMQMIRLESIVMNKQVEKLNKPPINGCYIHGIYLEGGSWDQESNQIVDQNPLELFTQIPPIHLKPVTHSFYKPLMYKCPIYQTPKRSGKLNSTGENINFIINLSLNCNQEQNEQFWLFRGLAGFLSLKN